MIKITQLPYERNSLIPYISEETISYHYDKHHKNYVNKLNEIIKGSTLENKSLEEIILNSNGNIFNNAAQIWNHTFYWFCMTPGGRKLNTEYKIYKQIIDSFGSIEGFEREFLKTAMSQFGSGWTWLFKNTEGKLSIVNTSNAGCLLTTPEMVPLLVCDVWEHAYYIDTRNDRQCYIKNFLNLIDWSFCEKIFLGFKYSDLMEY